MRATLATSAFLFVFALLLQSRVGPASISTPPISERLSIVSESASKTDAYPEIEELCDLIAPRLTGSVAEAKAEQLMLGACVTSALVVCTRKVGSYHAAGTGFLQQLLW